MNSVYDAQYFIDKFEAIPEELWFGGGKYSDPDKPECKCAFGHLGFEDNTVNSNTNESAALRDLFFAGVHITHITHINDGKNPEYQQDTPKQRILAALRDVQKGQPNE